MGANLENLRMATVFETNRRFYSLMNEIIKHFTLI